MVWRDWSPCARPIAAVTAPPLAETATLPVRPGLMTTEDLAGYEAIDRDPTVVDYRGYEVYGMAPPSSGGSTIGEALQILEAAGLGDGSREERSEEHTSELQSRQYLVCRLLLEKKKKLTIHLSIYS